MVDKQIIINGIDVSGCEHLGLYKEYKLKCGGCYPVNCSDNPNCYYKQLMREMQKCKNNKTAHQMELDIYNQECLNLQEELKAKEQECEELERELMQYEKDVKDLNHFAMKLKAENEELKQTLAEIKEIANRIYSEVITENWQSLLAKQILQKISECEV